MNYQNNKITDLKIAYIGGGSRGWAWTFMTDLAMEEQLSGVISLYDIDKEAARNNEKIGNELSAREDVVGKWRYETADSLKEALTGSDFVIISILPGTFDEMAVDVHTPEKYGIYQSVGDTAGPGGMIRALRTIPMFVEIAEAIKNYSPDAWVINYTNPMSLCVKTLYQVFPKIKAFGCCHEVFGTQKLLLAMLKEEYGIEATRDEIHVNVLGLNHFTWFESASYKGMDLFPIYEKFIDKYYETGFGELDKNWANASFCCTHRVKFDLFRRYGWIAAAGDRHLAEFMPGNEYLNNPSTVDSWMFGLTTVDWRKNDLKKRLERAKRLANHEEEVELKPTGEEGIRLIKALCGLERVVSNVNIPNRNGQIGNLPLAAIVETNAVFEKNAIRPMYAGELPKDILNLIRPHVDNHERIWKAAVTYNRELVAEAFAKDALIAGRLKGEQCKKLSGEMIEGTMAYLPAEWKIKK